jgi:DNA-binding CsgD family transcriptional regulator
MAVLRIVPKEDRLDHDGAPTLDARASDIGPPSTEPDKTAPGILVLAPPLQLLHMNVRAMDLMKSHQMAKAPDRVSTKVATGLLPAPILDLCKDVFSLLGDRSSGKDWERFEVRRTIGSVPHQLLLRGFGVPDARGASHSRVVVLVEPMEEGRAFTDEQAVQRFGFTPREQAVIKHLSQGATNKEIAQQLKISLPTVKEHLRHIMEKTRSSTRTGALVKILGRGTAGKL